MKSQSLTVGWGFGGHLDRASWLLWLGTIADHDQKTEEDSPVGLLRQAVEFAEDPFGGQQREERQHDDPVVPERAFLTNPGGVFW